MEASSSKRLEWYKPNFLKQLRKRVGMTQPKLGELSGFSRDDIANFERGLVRMSTDDALKLYVALVSHFSLAGKNDASATADALTAAQAVATRRVESSASNVDSAQMALEAAFVRLETSIAFFNEAQWIHSRLKAGTPIDIKNELSESYKSDAHPELIKHVSLELSRIAKRKQLKRSGMTTLRSLDGSSVEGWRGIKAQLQAEIRNLQTKVRSLQTELADVEDRLSEKE